MTNPTDPAAVAVAESVYDTFPLPIKGAKDCAARDVQRYGDQREKAAVERVVAWLRSGDRMAPFGFNAMVSLRAAADAIERGALKEASDG